MTRTEIVCPACHYVIRLPHDGAAHTLTTTLAAPASSPPGTDLESTASLEVEVETYTWDVLPDHLRTGSKAADIAREISFCVKELVG